MGAVSRLLPDGLHEALGGVYASVYWCIFPPSTQERVIPRLQDCQDNLCDRLSKLQQRARELETEKRLYQSHRDKTRLRRILIELRSLQKDIDATESTLWTVERQLQLIERSELDGAIIDTLHSASHALSGLSTQMPQVAHVDEVTSTLQDRMMAVHEVADAVDEALQRGLAPPLDDAGLEDELERLLADDPPPASDAGAVHNTQGADPAASVAAAPAAQTSPPVLQSSFEPAPAAAEQAEPPRAQRRVKHADPAAELQALLASPVPA